jgi:IclR family transcriptional regulator, KDG regulon repressor
VKTPQHRRSAVTTAAPVGRQILGSAGGPRPVRAEPNGTVQSLQRALSLLEALAETRGEIGIAELSRRVGLHVSTTHRLLATLIPPGYARQNPDTGRYALGPKVLHLAECFQGQVDLRRLARPVLEQLCRDTSETANLVILDGRGVLYLDKVESPPSLRIFSRIGRRASLYCTVAGKILLAFRPRTERQALLGRGTLERLTSHTITAAGLLQRELDKVQEQGFALDREECEEGATCIAAPVLDAGGAVEAALSISAPTVRFTHRRIEELIPSLVRLGQALSAQLGYGGSGQGRAGGQP